ncbi:hypothetical protein BXT84_10560 [Sulfobacillus thermotolerans]|uniref:ABC transporter domain-containing protein n=1 Tax=Sulfobacillus thermotolerans TaxID=338644 RepID=A0ABM6RSA7_9FIRM|nr:hypothetical protein BXT84_10560 [Sulfobacillus thermotolerans]
MTSIPVLQVSGISKSYNRVEVLHHVDLTVYPGEVRALIGHNGAGKSTLLRILSGAEAPDQGSIMVGGEKRFFASPRDAQEFGVAAVYQELRLLPQLSVGENIYLGHEPRSRYGIDRKKMFRAAEQLLQRHNIHIDPREQVGRLSHAQRQLVEVVAALERQARVILLDEPTTALQADQVDDLIRTVRGIVADGTVGVIFVSHKLDEVWSVADRLTVLRNGDVVLDKATREADKQEVIRFIVGDTHVVESSHGLLSSQKGSSGSQRTESRKMGPEILRVDNLSSRSLRSISLNVNVGEVVGLYGLEGSGRTDFFRLLYGLDSMIGGRIDLAGRPYHPHSPKRAMALGIAFVTEERKKDGFVPMLSTIQNVALPVLSRYQSFGFIHRSTVERAVLDTLKPLQLRGDPSLPATHLSGGNQQKMLFARTLMQNPRLILLDEPTKGVDIGAKAEIHRLIRDLVQGGDVGVMVISSEEEELLEVSDRIIVFRDRTTDGTSYQTKALTDIDLRNLALSEVVS